ncbi:MAG: hypothetical protein WCG93_12915 [Paludibacter sp.]
MEKTYILFDGFETYENPLENVEIGTSYPSQFHLELSDEQMSWKDSHPDATVQEVWNMELTPPYVDARTNSEKRQEQYGFRIHIELSQAFITYRAEAVVYRLENNEALALIADTKANEKAQEIAAIKEMIRIEYPD